MQPPKLSKILTPTLYAQITKIHFPWSGKVDIAFASRFYFLGTPDVSRELYDTLHHQALKPLSTLRSPTPSLGLEIEINLDLDLRTYLPNPTHPTYPSQTLALILLLDQSPRTLYGSKSLDSRYVSGFFDPLSKTLVRSLLSAGTLPHGTGEWTKQGYGFEDALMRKSWLWVPSVHSEEVGDHVLVEPLLEEMRREVEGRYRLKDPSREMDPLDVKDTTLFRELILAGPPKTPTTTPAEFFFWLLRVFCAHRPIVEEFGRYPYRNYALGRELTEREVEYLELTQDFGRGVWTRDEVLKLREMRERGVWEELSDKGPW